MNYPLSVAPVPEHWAPDSWAQRVALQQPHYDDPDELASACNRLAQLPPLVTSWEVLALKQPWPKRRRAGAFCCRAANAPKALPTAQARIISNRLKVLLQMSLVLVHGLQKPVLRVGRFAGQYAKPRSSDTETRNGVSLPSFRGDLINGQQFTAAARRADPQRMLRAHAHSALTMNFVRALVDGGFADLRHPEYWDLSWVEHSPFAAEYRHMVQAIGDSLRFMETLAGPIAGFSKVDFFTSHEALLLHYEQALTRRVPRNAGWFNLSTHFPWIGMRTAALDGAHVEYFRGIRNPIAVKIGPAVTPAQLLPLIDALNPHDEPGRLTLIHRMGNARIATALPPLLEAVKREGRRVLWVADPMHGNTENTSNGHKTRRFENIHGELDQAFDIHAAAGTRLGGVHLELTGEDVTECMGGARDLSETDLDRAYKSMVDPRLNYEQSLELAMLIVHKSGAGKHDV